ncbi:MAG TPA: amino acid adenylation domain-containing protein [Pyrinomonadaceae bacterium]|nr:amino acid adenylation domain-containing protein [Pyrinomonadaceae bacterium]
MQPRRVIEGYRLSPQQKRLWLAQRQSSDYHARCSILMEGKLSQNALNKALQQVIARHEILRTSFECLPGMEIPIQVISDAVAIRLELDFQNSTPEEFFKERAMLPIDFGRAPLLRCCLKALTSERHVLLLDMPSICSDAYSLRNLFREISKCYDERLSGENVVDEPLQYTQFSEWQNELLEGEDAKKGAAFWQTQLRNSIRSIALPLEKPRLEPTAKISGESGLETFGVTIGRELVEQIESTCKRFNVSLSTFLFTGWQILIYRLTGEPEVSVRCLRDGRKFEELRGALGLFAKMLPVVELFSDTSSFSKTLERVSRTLSEVQAWEAYFNWDEVPFSEEISGTHDYPICFEYEEGEEEREYGSVRFSLAEHQSLIERFKLCLTCERQRESLRASLRFDKDRYDSESIELLMTYYLRMLESATRAPELALRDLEIVGPELSEKILVDWNKTERDYGEAVCIHRLLEAQAEQRPNAAAVKYQQELMTYGELNARANRLANHLISHGVGPETRVVVFLERSIETIICLWAVWKSGAAYVPVDSAQPKARLKQMIEQVRPEVILTSLKLSGELPDNDALVVELDNVEVARLINQSNTRNPERTIQKENLAYLIFTSGSTGSPKAAMVEHHSVANLLHALDETVYRGERGLKVTLNGPLAFDGTMKQVIQMANGHTLVIVPEQIRADGRGMIDFLEKEAIDVLETTPSQLSLMLEAGLLDAQLDSAKKILVGGEAIDERLWRQMKGGEGRVKFYNLYGPTECTVDTTAEEVGQERDVPVIGKGLSNVRHYVLDSRLNPVPIGVPGELFIAGAGVGRGYFDRPDFTAEKFLPDPFGAAGARMYRSADIVNHLADGSLAYLHRADRQVKVRGNRTELGEIEEALLRLPEIRQAVVVANGEGSDIRLIAYVVASGQIVDQQQEGEYDLRNGMSIAHQNREETEALYEEIFENRSYEQRGVAIPEGESVVIDVGANIGMFTMYVAGRNPLAKVYALEPITEVCEKLRKNVRRHAPKAEVRQVAIGRKEGKEEFNYYKRMSVLSGMTKYASLREEKDMLRTVLKNDAEQGKPDAAELMDQAELLEWRLEPSTEKCDVKTLSDLLREEGIQRVGLLKIDVQRAEMDVLEGIREDDWTRIDQIVMEVHDKAGQGTQGRLVLARKMLERRGFRVEVDQDQRMSGTDRYNFYCVREGMTYSPGRQNDHWRQNGRRVWKRDLSPGQIKTFLKEQLPEYMVPAVIVMLKQLPINRNGKVDYEALPDPDQTQDHVPESLEHRTPYEEIIAGIWEEVLGVKVRSTAETFFDLGGHSLLATRVASRVRDALKVELPLRTLFEKPGLSALAGEIEMLKRQVGDEVLPKIVRVPRTQAMPLSYGQQRLWFLDQLEPGNNQYNSWRAIRLNGTLDEDALDRAIKEIVLRHEILRTRYVVQNGVPVQEVSDQEIEIEKVDLSREEEQLRENQAREIAREYGARGFDLETGPVIRLKLIRIRQGESVLVVVMHHIVCDAWSLSILVREVGVLYDRFRIGAESPLEPLKVQYADFAHWQRTWMEGETLPKQLNYWTNQLGGKLPELALPDADPSKLRTNRAERRVIDIDLELSKELKDLSRKEGASLFMTLLTAFNVLLNRYSGQEDILVGTPIAGRNRREIEDLIGFFINMLVIRTDLSGNPGFIELLGRVKEVTLAAYAHQDTPFEKLVEILQPERNLDRTPLFQVMFGLQNAPAQSLKLTDVNLSLLSFEQEAAHYDLSVWMFETAQGLSSVWTYRADLFQAPVIARMQKHFVRLLQSIVGQPEARLDAFDILTDSEKEEQAIKKRKLKEQAFQKFMTTSPQAVDTTTDCEPQARAISATPSQLD